MEFNLLTIYVRNNGHFASEPELSSSAWFSSTTYGTSYHWFLFYRSDVLPVTQPTMSTHKTKHEFITSNMYSKKLHGPHFCVV